MASVLPRICSAARPFINKSAPARFAKARAEHGMAQVGLGLVQGRYGEGPRGRTRPETGDLGEDEPDPVARLAAISKFLENALEGAPVILCRHEALELVGIGTHPRKLARPQHESAVDGDDRTGVQLRSCARGERQARRPQSLQGGGADAAAGTSHPAPAKDHSRKATAGSDHRRPRQRPQVPRKTGWRFSAKAFRPSR